MTRATKPKIEINDGQAGSITRNLSSINNATQPLDPYPLYVKRGAERLQQHGNTYIIQGTDRIGKTTDRLKNGTVLETPVDKGRGAMGEDGAHMIDLFVGAQGFVPVDKVDGKTIVAAGPNFDLDSARIYISQKVDIDDAFGLAPGVVGQSTGKSGIGIKADAVRIIGREGVKIVAGVSKTEPNKNSRKVSIGRPRGIDLIAGNQTDEELALQPLVKGNSLVDCLTKIMDNVDALSQTVDGIIEEIGKINTDLAAHIHISPFFGAPTSTSPNFQGAVLTHTIALEQLSFAVGTIKGSNDIIKFKYLNSTGKSNYICSNFNNTN